MQLEHQHRQLLLQLSVMQELMQTCLCRQQLVQFAAKDDLHNKPILYYCLDIL